VTSEQDSAWEPTQAPMAERKTEQLVLGQLTTLGYTEAAGIRVDAQKSENIDINKLFKGARKTSKGEQVPLSSS
jgi:hypothetical protein